MSYNRLYSLAARLIDRLISGTPEQVRTVWFDVQVEMEYWLRDHP